MSDYETTADLNEVIYYEKLDADMEMAAFEAEGARYAARHRRVEALLAEGRLEEATKLCDHGATGLLKGTCSLDDPRYGEEGSRCYDCGAVVTDLGGTVVHVR